tara:strand:+ start:626 stop:982 length:357 start_codon:yes stop_codon:yes gene_type:complete
MDDLDEDVQIAVNRLIADAAADGITLTIAETTRDPDRQAWLYGQGRGGNPGKEVTWTLNSKHLGGRAVDLWSEDNYGEGGWQWIQDNAGRYGFGLLDKSLGDYGHIEMPGGPPRRTTD